MIPLRSIDARDEDWTDLEAIGGAIGSARVVQLGEPSHGAGAAFAAKTRLMKFLHQRMGFDVLIWESGLYDVELTQGGLRSGEDVVTAARRGVFAIWSSAAEVRPLFEHARASQATTCPLDMAGFDLQVTAHGSRERFAEDLGAFLSIIRDPALRSGLVQRADEALAARTRLFASSFSEAADLESLQVAAAPIVAAIRTHRRAFDEVHGASRTVFMERAIENMRVDARLRFESRRSNGPSVERENRRDALNAANLQWLIEERYRGRKAVVWAHNAHIMNAYYAPDFRDVHIERRPGDMKPTGVFLRDWLGQNVYTIGVTAYGGEDGLATGGERTVIQVAPEGSLESQLHALEEPCCFVDLRALDEELGHPLRRPQIARVPKYDGVVVSDLGRIYDGLLCIDQMTPATPVRA